MLCYELTYLVFLVCGNRILSYWGKNDGHVRVQIFCNYLPNRPEINIIIFNSL